jgi:hypothetical protein
MKVIMDINKDILTDVKGTDFDRARNIVRSYQATIADAIQNSIVLPEGATNGDMIKAMFPNVECKEDILGNVFIVSDAQLGYIVLRESWWNAPYKRD